MREELMTKAKKATGAEQKINLLREELHHLVLQETDRKGGFAQLCFLGGTALRILFGLDRFSEDLDFSTSSLLTKPFQLSSLTRTVQDSLNAYGFNCEIKKFKSVGAVQSCFFTFENLLYSLDPSFRKNQKFSIKFEVDTNPPKGAKETTSPIATDRLYRIRHYDLSSLFAGKLHAVLSRLYTKGRDLYDFLWYVGKQAIANKTLLENALEQTQKKRIHLTPTTLQNLLREKFEATDFEKAKKDVAPFLADRRGLTFFEKELFLNAATKVTLAD